MTVRVAIPDLVSPSYLPLIAAVELGFFEREGFPATIELIFPVTKTFECLRDGTVDLVGGAAHAPVYAFESWADCKLVCALSQHMYWFLVVRRDLDGSRGDLDVVRGLRLGAAPGPVDGLMRMLAEAGIDPERDVDIGPVVGTDEDGVSFGVAAARALEAGSIDGFWANGMGAEVAVRRGAGTVIVDARRGDGPPGAQDYTFPALVISSRRLEEQPEVAKAAVRAVVAAQQALREDPGLATEACRSFPEDERSLIAELVGRDAPFYRGAITPHSVEALVEFSRGLGLLDDAPSYEDVVAAQFASLWVPGDTTR